MLVGLRDYQDEKADVILKCGAAVREACCFTWAPIPEEVVQADSLNDVVTLCSLDNTDGFVSFIHASVCYSSQSAAGCPAHSLGLTCSCAHPGRYMADEARSLKAYGELPENSARPAPYLGILAISVHWKPGLRACA